MKYIIPFIIFIFISFMPFSKKDRHEYSTFRVVLDPGHGGINNSFLPGFNDKYDAISGKYLDYYKEGASYKGLKEHNIVYNIAKKTNDILQFCSPAGEYTKFYEILKKYSSHKVERIYIITSMSRKKSITKAEASKTDDPNSEYRLFDYPDKNGIIHPGRISKINALKPHLVVSLHLGATAPSDYKGMNPVIAAPGDFLYHGLLYLRGIEKSKKFFCNSPYNNWFRESVSRSSFKWFLNDVSSYLTGFHLNKHNKVRLNSFKGYRYNMVTWKYKDDIGWEDAAKIHNANTRYSSNYNDITWEGKFLERERSKYEKFRRENGYEGFGGDNAYASYEIIRYILYSLYLKGLHHRRQAPGKSYISTWSVPVFTNAINAYIELGYLKRRRDRRLLTSKQDEIAEGIAVGIYSLLAGLKPGDKKFKYAPKGKKLNLEKYNITDEKNYFNIVDK